MYESVTYVLRAIARPRASLIVAVYCLAITISLTSCSESKMAENRARINAKVDPHREIETKNAAVEKEIFEIISNSELGWRELKATDREFANLSDELWKISQELYESYKDVHSLIDEIIAENQTCSFDWQCGMDYFGCPFGCGTAINKSKRSIVEDAARTYDESFESCYYICLPFDAEADCIDQKCTAVFD